MSASSLGVSAASGAPITISGLASGLETRTIIAALMGVEREPVTHLDRRAAEAQAEQTQLQERPAAAFSSWRPRPPNSACPRCLKARRASPRANRRGSAPSPSPARASAATRSKSRSSPTRRSARSRSKAPPANRNDHDRRSRIHAQGGRERQGTGERDQLQQQRDGLRGGARRRHDRAVQSRDRRHRRRIHQGHDRRSAERKGRHRAGKARTPNSASMASKAAPPRTPSPTRSPGSR